jgi:hypothetical protein
MENWLPARFIRPVAVSRGLCAAIALTVLIAGPASADDAAVAPKDGTIGYALTSLRWAIYQSPDGKAECPDGMNEGPREQFKTLFPDDGTKRTVVDTQLKRESAGWLPTTEPEPFTYHEATGRISLGMNLDGKVGPNDFTSPEGEPGIDNQMFRVMGCIPGYRGPDGVEYIFGNKPIVDAQYNRTMIELTGVDNLNNAGDVQVTIYRGLDPLLNDATGANIMPGGSQRIDTRWGARFIQHLHGKIVDGVLATEPTDIIFPWATLGEPTIEAVHGMRLRLKLTPTGAEGLMAGYTDFESWYGQLMRNDSTHHQSNGQISAPSIYRSFRRLADGYPDPGTGENTAISSALVAKFTQVYILHAPVDAAGGGAPVPSHASLLTPVREAAEISQHAGKAAAEK